MTRLAILISGGGSNLQAIIDAIAGDRLDAEIAVVVSNKSKAFGLERARRASVETLVFTAKAYRKRAEWRDSYDADLAERVAAYAPDLVILAGWMHILSGRFLKQFPRRVINLHPALPGQFVGTHAIERAFEAWSQGEIDHSGVMVHWVIPEVDAGDPIATASIPFEAGDTLESFETRVHETEHRLLVEAIGKAIEQMQRGEAQGRSEAQGR